MPIPDFWETDLRMLQIVIELQASHGGAFPLDTLIDRVYSIHPADHADIYTVLTPWAATESLRRLADGNFIIFTKESDDPETIEEEVKFLDWGRFPERAAESIPKWKRRKERLIREALYRGMSSQDAEDPDGLAVSACWRRGRFFVNDVQQLYSIAATPDGLRRVGAWPNPEVFTEELVAILGGIAESIEAKRPEDAKTLRQIGRVLKANAIELSAAVLAKLLERAAGL